MTVLAFQNLRGGSGTTSVCVSLAWALAARQQSVLLVDFSRSNLLRLYFNHPVQDRTGWALSVAQQQPFNQPIRYHNTLAYLPFGTLDKDSLSTVGDWLNAQKQQRPETLPDALNVLLANREQWLFIDCSSTSSALIELAQALADLNLYTLNADVASQVLLSQQTLPDNHAFLINRFVPISQVQQDVSHVWQQRLAGCIPVLLHADEAQNEALALKQPLGECRPESLISQDIQQLADWLIQRYQKDAP